MFTFEDVFQNNQDWFVDIMVINKIGDTDSRKLPYCLRVPPDG